MRPRIVVLTAMELEARALAVRLGGLSVETAGGLRTASGELAGVDVDVTVTGIGKVAAARAAQRLLVDHADALLVAGISGSLDAAAAMDAIVVAEAAAQHDLDVRPLAAAPGVVPELGEAIFPAAADWRAHLAEAARGAAAQQGWPAGVVEGLVVSGDAIIRSEAQRAPIDEHFPSAIAVDMETAAIAHVARLEGVAWGAVRTISDGADDSLEVAEVLAHGERSSVLLAAIVEAAIVAWAGARPAA